MDAQKNRDRFSTEPRLNKRGRPIVAQMIDRQPAVLRALAEHLSDGRLDPEVLAKLPDDEVIAALTSIPGIGPWTAQGALILALRREDVVLPGDLALRKAIRRAYELDHLPSEGEVLAIAENWRPYRSVATSYLFSSAFDASD